MARRTCGECKCTERGYPRGHRWCRLARENRRPEWQCAYGTCTLGHIFSQLYDELRERGSRFPGRVVARAAVERERVLVGHLLGMAKELARHQPLTGEQWTVIDEAEAALRQLGTETEVAACPSCTSSA